MQRPEKRRPSTSGSKSCRRLHRSGARFPRIVCIVVSTASPFKFCDNVLGALGEKDVAQGLDVLDQLTSKTGLPAPTPLASLRNKHVRFTQVVEKEHMVDAVLSMLR